MSQMSQSNLGNTSNQIARIKSRKWCFTLNNYSEDEYNEILSQILKKSYIYIIGKEIGENGTPHLQGYIEHKHQIDFNSLKKINNRLHLEKANGSKIDNFNYCSKDGDFITNIKLPEPLKKVELFAEWQFNLLNTLLTTEPNDRHIYWYWSNKGNLGKSTFVKYMFDNHNAGFINKGKYRDMIHQIFTMETIPKIILIDIPKCMNSISYSALEDIKNGLIANSKYETGVKRFNPPHIVVFCNFPPKDNIFSDDRLLITCLDPENLEIEDDHISI